MTLSLFILLTTCILNIGILFFVISKQKNSKQLTPSLFFGVSIITILIWATCNYLADTTTSVDQALFWTRASFPAALCMGFSLVIFSYIFPVRQIKKLTVLYVYAFFCGIFSLLSMGDFVITSIGITKNVGVSQVTVGPLYHALVLMYLLLILQPTYNFIRSYKNLTGKHRSQIKYVLAGWISFLLLAITTNAILPLITGNANWSKFGPLGSIVMVLAISYAIVKHEFLDIKIIIQKGIVYSLLLSGITGIYLLLVFTFGTLFNRSGDTNILLSALLTTILGIFGAQPLERLFQKLTAKVFFKDAYDYATVLRDLTDELNTNIALDAIVEKTSTILQQALKATTVTFHFGETVPQEETSSVVIQIKSNTKRIGYLVLGEKRSGDSYTEQDLSLLDTFTKQAGTALEKASLYMQVKEYAKTLEEKVEARTKEIITIQKEQESLMLEISHGLQTPLTIMKGELYFLRKQGYDTAKVDTIDASIDRISTFIYRFLSLSKLETSHEQNKNNIDLSETAASVISFFRQKLEEQHIKLTEDISPDITLLANREEIEELISNLISNSIKYKSKERPSELHIRLCKNEKSTILRIEDNGIGMRQEHISNLFKKFYRIKEQETKGIPGTGLGLVITKKIVEKHGGTITVESKLGSGTTFTITFPNI